VIVNIILDVDKPPIPNDLVVILKMPPAYILLKLDQTWVTRLEGLKE
jgi:hypothetical protein